MGFFDGSKDSPAGEDGSKLGPGVYPALQVLSEKVIQGHFGVRRIVNFLVLATAVVTDPSKAPTGVGAIGSVGIRLDGEQRKAGLGENNAITGALQGHTVDGTNARLAEIEMLSYKAVGPEQIHRGRVVSGEIYHKLTQKGFTMVKARLDPWAGRVEIVPAAADARLAAGDVAPSAPPAPPPARSNLERALEAGFVVHPTSRAHVYRGDTCDTPDALAAAGLI